MAENYVRSSEVLNHVLESGSSDAESEDAAERASSGIEDGESDVDAQSPLSEETDDAADVKVEERRPSYSQMYAVASMKREELDTGFETLDGLKGPPPNLNLVNSCPGFFARAKTFDFWPPVLKQLGTILAWRGILSTGNGDEVMCVNCKKPLRGREISQQPFDRDGHCDQNCPFLV